MKYDYTGENDSYEVKMPHEVTQPEREKIIARGLKAIREWNGQHPDRQMPVPEGYADAYL